MRRSGVTSHALRLSPLPTPAPSGPALCSLLITPLRLPGLSSAASHLWVFLLLSALHGILLKLNTALKCQISVGCFLFLGFGGDSADEEGLSEPPGSASCQPYAEKADPWEEGPAGMHRRGGTTHSLANGHSLHYPVFPRPLLKCHPLTEASSQYPFKTRTRILVPLHCSMWPF